MQLKAVKVKEEKDLKK